MASTNVDLKVEKMREELRKELHDFMNNMELRFTNFATKFEREQETHHKENKARLISIDTVGKETSKTTTETSKTTASLESRMNLLFDEKGKGIVYDLEQEIRKLNHKITYLGGAMVGAYILFNILRSLGLMK